MVCFPRMVEVNPVRIRGVAVTEAVICCSTGSETMATALLTPAMPLIMRLSASSFQSAAGS